MAANIIRFNRKFEIAKTKVTTDFALPEAPIEWKWEGQGAEGNLIARRPDTTVPNTPVPNVTLRNERYIIIPAPDIYQMYFTSLPPGKFKNTTVTQNGTLLIFDLHLEE